MYRCENSAYSNGTLTFINIVLSYCEGCAPCAVDFHIFVEALSYFHLFCTSQKSPKRRKPSSICVKYQSILITFRLQNKTYTYDVKTPRHTFSNISK